MRVTSEAGLTLEETRANAFLSSLFERKPTITWSIAVVCVVVFGLQMLWGAGNPYISATRMGAMLPSFVMSGQVWRILAPMVLHGSVIHLVMNMLALFSFGTFLERLLGWRRYLILYILSGLGGSLASFLRPQEVMSVGASGGIWGLMVGGAVLLSVPRGTLPEIVSRTQKRRAWFPVVINAAYSFQPGIDWLAHLGGGLVGAVLVLSGFMTLGLPKAEAGPLAKKPQDGLLLRVLAPLFAAALIGSVGIAVFMGRPWELQSTPQLRSVVINHVELQLPNLLGATRVEDASTYAIGALRLDPVAFVVRVLDSEDPAANPEDLLNEALQHAKPNLFAGFHQVVSGELRRRDDVSFLFDQQAAADGRTCDRYSLVQGRYFLTVLVMYSNETSAAWREVASKVPFSIRVR